MLPGLISAETPARCASSRSCLRRGDDHFRRAGDALLAQHRLVVHRAADEVGAVGREAHHPGLGIGERRLAGDADIDRHLQVGARLAGMAGVAPGLAIGAGVVGQLRERAGAHRREQRIAELADRRIGVVLAGGDADFRMRLLHRARHQGEVLEAVVAALVGGVFLGPRLLDDLKAFGEALRAFLVGDAVGVIGARKGAAPDPEDQPSAADLVDRRGFLGEAQRVPERQDLHRGADLDAAGARRDGARHGQRRRQQRAGRVHVDFGQPHDVEAPALGRVDLREGLRERLGLGLRLGRKKLVEDAEFHPGRV